MDNQNSDFKNVTFADNRVFVDIGKGCGNACSYCYCDEALEPQILYEEEYIRQVAQYVINDKKFDRGREGTIISLCPHTEPLLSCDATSRILEFLKIVLPLGNIVQIATKAVLDEKFVEKISKISKRGQVVIFISISSIIKSNVYEPYAPSVYDRLENILICRKYKVVNCLYVKPFLIKGIDEFKRLSNIIEKYKPDAVCTGIIYNKVKKKGLYNHPTNKEVSSDGINNEINDFYHFVQKKCFYTSSCVLASINGIMNRVDIPKTLCVQCNQACYKGKW